MDFADLIAQHTCTLRLAQPLTLECGTALAEFSPPAEVADLPSSCGRPLLVHEGETAPQPRLHSGQGNGMTVSVGRVRRCPVLGIRFVALVHNTIRGAAGAAVLSGELLSLRGLVPTPCGMMAVREEDDADVQAVVAERCS